MTTNGYHLPATGVDIRTQNRPEMEAWPKEESEMQVFKQVNGIVIYYMVLLFLAFGFLMVLLSVSDNSNRPGNGDLFEIIGYLMVGSFFGSILYQIRQLYNFYIKDKSYSYKWFGKYLTAPWESAAMALIVLSILRSSSVLFSGVTNQAAALTDVTPANNFASFGMGALVGFGMRDVVGWLGNIVRSVFVSQLQKEDNRPEEMQHTEAQPHPLGAAPERPARNGRKKAL